MTNTSFQALACNFKNLILKQPLVSRNDLYPHCIDRALAAQRI